MAVMLDVGLVPDEVLLRCGAPSSVPSEFWTPWLAASSQDEAASLRAAADEFLVEQGVLDPGTGALSGPLGVVADVVADATLVVTWEGEIPGSVPARGAFVAAGDRVLVDRQDMEAGAHGLWVVDPATAVAWLADGLDPVGAAAPGVTEAGVTVPADEVEAALEAASPVGDRRWTLRLARVVTGAVDGVGSEGLAHTVTVLVGAAAVHAVWALRDGGVLLQQLDEGGVVELALALLGAELLEGSS